MTRNASYDYARLLAAFGIVLFHSGVPGARWGYGGLPFFLVMLGAFVAPMAARMTTTAFARARSRRLLVPWLAWSAVYLALMVAQDGPAALARLDASMLLTGPALHLWFLPFAFVAGVGLHALARAVGPRTLGWIGAGAAWLFLGLSQAGPWPVPLAQWLFALPALGLGLLLSTETPARQVLGVALVLGGALALGWTADFTPLLIGLAAFVLCRAVPLPETPRTRALADVALTVYLAHPLVQTLLVWATGLRTDTYVCVALVIAVTTLAAWVQSRLAVLPRPASVAPQ